MLRARSSTQRVSKNKPRGRSSSTALRPHARSVRSKNVARHSNTPSSPSIPMTIQTKSASNSHSMVSIRTSATMACINAMSGSKAMKSTHYSTKKQARITPSHFMAVPRHFFATTPAAPVSDEHKQSTTSKPTIVEATEQPKIVRDESQIQEAAVSEAAATAVHTATLADAAAVAATTKLQQDAPQETTPHKSIEEVASTEAAASGSDTPAYAKLQRKEAPFVPTESYFDENGDECLVVYQADEESLQRVRQERTRGLINLLGVGPAVTGISLVFLPSPWSYLMMGCVALFAVKNCVRVYGLTAFVTKIVAVWPKESSEITSKLVSNLNEAYQGLHPVFQDEQTETEFQSRQKHNEQIQQEAEQKQQQHTEQPDQQQHEQQQNQSVAEDALQKLTQATDSVAASEESDELNDKKKQIEDENPIYPQPGVDPMGQRFSFHQNSPDNLTWKFGWNDATRRAAAINAAANGLQPPLFQRADWTEQVIAWKKLPDPDFPEYLYIDRFNNGSKPLYQKLPLSNLTALWTAPIVPPQIPQVVPEQIQALHKLPYDQSLCMVRAQDTISGLFPRFVKHDVAMNQILFAANINARNEVSPKFEQIRGRYKI